MTILLLALLAFLPAPLFAEAVPEELVVTKEEARRQGTDINILQLAVLKESMPPKTDGPRTVLMIKVSPSQAEPEAAIPTPGPEKATEAEPEPAAAAPEPQAEPEAAIPATAPEKAAEPVPEPPKKFLNLVLKAGLSPYTLGVYDFYNGHGIPGARYLTATDYGLSADLGLDWRPIPNLGLFLDSGYSFVLKPVTVLPGGLQIHYAHFEAGLEGRIPAGERLELGGGLFCGAMLHFNAGKGNASFSFGGRLTLEWRLGENLSLGLASRARISLLGNDDPLYRSATWLVDPLVLALGWRF